MKKLVSLRIRRKYGVAGIIDHALPQSGYAAPLDASGVRDFFMQGSSHGVQEVASLPVTGPLDAGRHRVARLGGGAVAAAARTARRSYVQHTVKELVDFYVSVLLFIILAPVLLSIAATIRVTSPGPVLFRQQRYGLHQRPFTIFKFRTMYEVCEDPHAVQQTSRADPRVTPVGRLLRRTNLDELPQILNVLRGEMSLVGPRPHAIGMRTNGQASEDIVDEYSLRYSVKPGITGWAQINGSRGAMHNPDDLVERVEKDLYYIRHWSLLLDARILLLTLMRSFRDPNAY